MRTQQAVVDRDRCVGSGICVASMPELFDLDDDYVSTTKNGGRVAAALADLAAEAAEQCPTHAITLRPAEA